MNRWICGFSCLFGLFQSCATSDALKTVSIGERNVDNLARLNLGMSESQVVQIMRDPYKEEAFQVESDHYDVLFYVTTVTVLSQTRMVPMNLTPLTFKNQLLVGMGYSYYRWLKEQRQIQTKSKLSPEIRKVEQSTLQEHINTSIENATSFNTRPVEMLSMSSPPKKEKELADPPPPSNPDSSPSKEKDIKMNEEDKQMIDDEQDQNFDFW